MEEALEAQEQAGGREGGMFSIERSEFDRLQVRSFACDWETHG